MNNPHKNGFPPGSTHPADTPPRSTEEPIVELTEIPDLPEESVEDFFASLDEPEGISEPGAGNSVYPIGSAQAPLQGVQGNACGIGSKDSIVELAGDVLDYIVMTTYKGIPHEKGDEENLARYIKDKIVDFMRTGELKEGMGIGSHVLALEEGPEILRYCIRKLFVRENPSNGKSEGTSEYSTLGECVLMCCGTVNEAQDEGHLEGNLKAGEERYRQLLTEMLINPQMFEGPKSYPGIRIE